MGQVSHLFLVIPNCPYSLLGRDLLSKLGLRFHSIKIISTTNQKEQPILVLTLQFEDKYRLHQGLTLSPKDIAKWLTQYPEAFTETRDMGLAGCQPPGLKLKPDATPLGFGNTLRHRKQRRESPLTYASWNKGIPILLPVCLEHPLPFS